MKEYKRPRRDNEWSQEEIKKLIELYPRPDKTIEEIAFQLPGRTLNAIRLKARRLDLHRPFIILLNSDSSYFFTNCVQSLEEDETWSNK